MAVTFGSSTTALALQRGISRADALANRSLERLSTGMRINHASDDAAGLAVSMSLNSSQRIYGQAVRNANDAISMTNISSSALEQLGSIGIQLQELAEQAANGAYSSSQRLQLHQQAKQLTKEYNRVIASTSFNGLNILSGTSRYDFQLGIGGNEALGGNFNAEISRTAGSGTYTTVASANADLKFLRDFDSDGKADLVTSDGSVFRIIKGNGDGTFGTTLHIGGSITYLGGTPGDFDGNGTLDLFTQATGFYKMSRNNTGAGTFSDFTSGGTLGTVFKAANMNSAAGDELITINGTSLRVYTGLIPVSQVSSVTVSGTMSDIAVGDLNGDGFNDVVSTDASNNTVKIFTNNGSGKLTEVGSFTAGSGGGLTSVSLIDANYDGVLDVVSSGSGGTRVTIGNGDATFSNSTTVIGSQITTVRAADVNSDGVLDIVGERGTTLLQFINDGDGGFTEQALGTITSGLIDIADMNGDGAVDIAAIGSSRLNNTNQSSTTSFFNLSTAANARVTLDLVQTILEKIGREQGVIGAFQSRLATELETLRARSDNYSAAASRITDADVAEETASLTRAGILRQASATVASQANQQPRIALALLGLTHSGLAADGEIGAALS
ncbi:MAG: VCBS repeat-containing protein [Deltaproteobacteria bacterium]|nr:VCBS repeat-containing protein [Deltaproteobacteria bacterium]